MTCRSLAWLLGASLWLVACDEIPGAAPNMHDAAHAQEPAKIEEAGLATSVDAAVAREDRDATPAPAAEQDARPVGAERDAQLSLDAAVVSDAAPASPAPSPADAGSPSTDFAVGTMRVEIGARGERKLPLQLWYPAVESARAEASAGHGVSELEPAGPRRELLDRLLTSAPAGCANRRMHAALGAAPQRALAPYPLLVYSHHLEGMRLALFSLAERLARLGFVVAAPDHTEMTLYDRTDDLKSEDLIGTALRFRFDGLAIRAQDIESVIDVLLDPAAQAIPDGIRGQIDRARVGVFGHSMGSMTMGIVAQRDRRVSAAAYLSFPPAQTSALLNLLDQPAIGTFRVPALFMLNQEDTPVNSIGGNDAIREQFAAHAPLSYLVEVRDTGHWSFADDCALIPDFADGCGPGTRPTEPFDAYQNLNNEQAREIAARYLAAFFGSQYLAQPAGPLTDSANSPHELVRSHAPLKDTL